MEGFEEGADFVFEGCFLGGGEVLPGYVEADAGDPFLYEDILLVDLFRVR